MQPTPGLLLPGYQWWLGTAVPYVAVAVRRLHDVNRSGWWCLLWLPLWVGAVAGDLHTVGWLPIAEPSLTICGVAGAVVSVPLLVLHLMAPRSAGRRFDTTPPDELG